MVALLDKLLEYERGRHPRQLVSCLLLLLRAAPLPSLRLQVDQRQEILPLLISINLTLSLSPSQPRVLQLQRREVCLQRYGDLVVSGVLPVDCLFGVPPLKDLSRWVAVWGFYS